RQAGLGGRLRGGGVVVLPAVDLAVVVVVQLRALDDRAVHEQPRVGLSVLVPVKGDTFQASRILVVLGDDRAGSGRGLGRTARSVQRGPEREESENHAGTREPNTSISGHFLRISSAA